MIFSFLVKWAKKKKTPQVKIILEIDSTNLLGFLGDSDSKESACNSGDLGSIPGLGRPLGKEMATHSSILVWRIPWTEEPGGVQSMGSQRAGHD